MAEVQVRIPQDILAAPWTSEQVATLPEQGCTILDSDDGETELGAATVIAAESDPDTILLTLDTDADPNVFGPDPLDDVGVVSRIVDAGAGIELVSILARHAND